MSDRLKHYRAERLLTAAQAKTAFRFSDDHASAVRWMLHRSEDDRPGAERFREDCRAVGPLRRLVIAVAVEGEDAGSWCERTGHPSEQGMQLLRRALAELARVYREGEGMAEAAE